MVAYSFKRRFFEPILSGTKCQTVRAPRRRHALPGERLQLYADMRTKSCELIACAMCVDVYPINILFNDDDPELEGIITPGLGFPGGLEGFAIADGFASWEELKAFWRENHPGVDDFEGSVICWGELL